MLVASKKNILPLPDSGTQMVSSLSSKRILYPSKNSVHIFFIFSVMFKDIVYCAFMLEALVNLSAGANNEFDVESFAGAPLIVLLTLAQVMKICEIFVQSHLAYVDPKTMLLGTNTR